MQSLSTRQQAEKSPATHQFVMGVGYIRHAGQPHVRTPVSNPKNCAPPADAAEGSLHILRRSPNGEPVTFSWTAGAWKAVTTTHMLKGARMAFLASYLSSVGWEYVGVAEDPAPAEEE